MGAESEVLGTISAFFFLAPLFGVGVEAGLVFIDTVLGFGGCQGFLAGMADLGRGGFFRPCRFFGMVVFFRSGALCQGFGTMAGMMTFTFPELSSGPY